MTAGEGALLSKRLSYLGVFQAAPPHPRSGLGPRSTSPLRGEVRVRTYTEQPWLYADHPAMDLLIPINARTERVSI